MCGIVGALYVGGQAGVVDPTILRHRGPDGSGALSLRLPWGHLSLGQTRLAIVGGKDVAVPYDYRGSCGVVLAFNGEIYNWRELRIELGEDIPWESECDAEVLARGYARWGSGVLDRLNGMFAFCAVDVRQGSILLARDRAGEKPLYWSLVGGVLRFASEVSALGTPLREKRGLLPEVDALEFDCLEDTPFDGVYQLGPGRCWEIDRPEGFAAGHQRTWWTLPTEADEGMGWEEAVRLTQEAVVAAVETRARGDHVTALVSGGLDSAIVQAVAKFPEVYCVTFPAAGVDPLPMARLASQGAEVVPVTFGRSEAEGVLEQVAWHLCTPATWPALSYWFLGEAIAARGHKVVLSGDGADELFAGYARYRVLHWLQAALEDEGLVGYGPTLRTALGGTPEAVVVRLLDRSPEGRQAEFVGELFRRFGRGFSNLVSSLASVEWHTTMQVNLRMADRMLAAWGLENRGMFFDHRVIEVAQRIPIRWKVRVEGSKWVLREVARRLGVPKTVVEDPRKVGLPCPWNRWRGVTGEGSSRGVWDRSDFRGAMLTAWRAAYNLRKRPDLIVHEGGRA